MLPRSALISSDLGVRSLAGNRGRSTPSTAPGGNFSSRGAGPSGGPMPKLVQRGGKIGVMLRDFVVRCLVMIDRAAHLAKLRELLDQFPVVGLIGARQVGKTTLAMAYASGFAGEVTRFDLENPRDLHRLDDPLFALETLRGLVVLDEIQLRPEIFPVLRVLADRRPVPAPYLVLGRGSPPLLRP